MKDKSGPKVLGNDPFKRAAAPLENAKPQGAPAPPPPPRPAEPKAPSTKAPKPAPEQSAKPPRRALKPPAPPEVKAPLAEQIAQRVAKEPASSPPTRLLPVKPVMTPVPDRAAKPKAAAPKPPPPPKVVVPRPVTAPGSPARRAVTSFASFAASPPPKVTAPDRPSGKFPRPVAGALGAQTPEDSAPVSEAGPLAQPASSAATPPSPRHKVDPAAPGFAPRADLPPAGQSPAPAAPREFGPHQASPDLRAEFTAHDASPVLKAEFTPHDASPELRAEFTPHETSPELRAEFTPHETSPELRAEFTPHETSPELVGEVAHGQAVPHTDSPQLVSDRTSALESTPAPDLPPSSTGVLSPLFAAASGLAQAAKAALGLGAAGTVDAWGKDPTLTRALQPVGDFLYDRYFRVSVAGADLVPAGPSILVANHSGALPLDGPMLHFALQRERPDLPAAQWLVEDQVFHAPFIGVLINRLGAVRAHPENAVRLLAEKRPVIVFPEGFLGISKPFTQRYQLKRFGRGGYVKLALKERVPIVPVAVVGAEESMPLLAKLPAGALGLPYLPLTPPPLPARWQIRFSEPITVSGNPDDLAYVQQQNDRVRDTIAGMLAAMLAEPST